jgi:hypothetical protein
MRLSASMNAQTNFPQRSSPPSLRRTKAFQEIDRKQEARNEH